MSMKDKIKIVWITKLNFKYYLKYIRWSKKHLKQNKQWKIFFCKVKQKEETCAVLILKCDFRREIIKWKNEHKFKAKMGNPI